MHTNHYHWQRTLFGHNFSISRSSCGDNGEGIASVIQMLRLWIHTHEDTQVMLASVLVIIGLWWMVRAALSLLINLVCPLLVVLLAVIFVPQLRAPLLGHNYPAIANLLRNMLIKMAENIKT